MESSKLEQLIKLLSRENVKLKEKVAMLQDQLRIIHNINKNDNEKEKNNDRYN